MPDEGTQEEETSSSAEQTAGDSQTQEQTTGTETQDSGDQKGDDQSKTAADTASKDDEKKQSTQDSKPEFKPVSRRSMAYRIKQLAKENTELKRQVESKGQDDQGDEDAGDDQPKPDIEALVAREVDKRLNPVMSEHTKVADDGEINEFFSGDKANERAKYEEPIRNAWKLEQYKDLAASDLYKILTFDEAIANANTQAVEEYKKAAKEAKDSSASGSSNTSNRTGKAPTLMTDEEILAHNEKVKAGKA